MGKHGWLDEGQLLEGRRKLQGIPGVIVQGRHDCCTPPRAAWELNKAWPEVELEIVPDGGHCSRARHARRAGPRHGQVSPR